MGVNKINYRVSEDDLELMVDVFYDARGALIPAIIACQNKEEKTALRHKEHRLRKLKERAQKCLDIIRGKEDAV